MIEKAPDSARRASLDWAIPPAGGRFIFGRRASLLISAGVVGHTLWTSAAPALTYRLYAEEWHLTHTMTAGIFAVYPIAVVALLTSFGGISDSYWSPRDDAGGPRCFAARRPTLCPRT
jgi:hypothetical protein